MSSVSVAARMGQATRRCILLGALVIAAAIGGCVSGATLDASVAVDPTLGPVELLPEGGFRLDVPLDVYFLGFDAATVAAVAAKLTPLDVEHSASSSDRAFPPSPDTTPLGGASFPAPAHPRAVFRAIDLDEETERAFFEAAASWKVEESDAGALDANAAEAWLAERLAQARGAPLDRSAPVFVVLHGGGALGNHTWRYDFSHGWLENVRIFGERLPVTVFDTSAQPDPFVVAPRRSPEALVFGTAFGLTQPAAYDYPIEASGDATVDALAQLSVDAAHWRFLKGPLYPISTRPCHHVTLLLAIHTTSATEALPGWTRAKDWIDVEGLRSAFVNLTGDEVTVELKVYQLPQDEPALDALARGAGTLVGLDALRWYLDENFDSFVDPQEGCEEYLSLLLWGDAAAFTLTGGIGTYDVQRGHRLAFAFVPETTRLRDLYEGPAGEVVNDREASRARWNWATMLYAHETGHIFGQQHPQHISRTKEGLGTKHSFEAVYSIMGYQQDDRMVDFGSVDHATWTMGRVGYTIAEARALGLDATPAFVDALDHLRLRHWEAAHLALEADLQEAEAAGPERLPAFHLVDAHVHDWG